MVFTHPPSFLASGLKLLVLEPPAMSGINSKVDNEYHYSKGGYDYTEYPYYDYTGLHNHLFIIYLNKHTDMWYSKL